jgi:hypothetical protein
MQSFSFHSDGVTPIKVGDVINFNYSPARTSGAAGVETSPVTAAADDQTLATVAPNTGIGNQSGSTVTMLKAGTVTITVSSTNENNVPYHSQYQVVIAALPVDLTDHFVVTEAN